MPRSARRRDALPLGDELVEQQEQRRRRVDRHRRRHLAERDAGEQDLHVGDRVDRDAGAPDLAERARVVGVVAELRRQVERDRQPRLTALEQVAVALVRLLRRREAGVLPDRPRPAAVHVRVRAARVRVLARRLERRRRIVRRVDRLHLDPGLGFAPVGGRHGESMLARVRVLACVLLATRVLVVRRGGAASRAAQAASGTLDVHAARARCTPSRSRSCTDRVVGKAPVGRPAFAGRRGRPGARAKTQRIWVHGRLVFSHAENGPVVLAEALRRRPVAVLRDRPVRVRVDRGRRARPARRLDARRRRSTTSA